MSSGRGWGGVGGRERGIVGDRELCHVVEHYITLDFIAKCQYTDCTRNVLHGGAKYTHLSAHSLQS